MLFSSSLFIFHVLMVDVDAIDRGISKQTLQTSSYVTRPKRDIKKKIIRLHFFKCKRPPVSLNAIWLFKTGLRAFTPKIRFHIMSAYNINRIENRVNKL